MQEEEINTHPVHLSLCAMTLLLEHKDHRHPLDVMKELGITYQHKTPQSMSDAWWFWNCKNIPPTLPSYLKRLEVDPMECIGWGLSKQDAEKISNQTK